MTAKLVRLKLPPKILAHIKALELRRHLQSSLSKLPKCLSASDECKLLGIVLPRF